MLSLWLAACQPTPRDSAPSERPLDSGPEVLVEVLPGLDLAPPRVSPGRGVYEGELLLTLTAEPEARVLYTLDGADPRTGEELDGPIPLAGDERAVRLRAVSLVEGVHSAELSATYVFVDPVLAQPAAPQGFPETWGVEVTTAADYEMDPEVTGLERARATAGLLELPAVVVWMDPDDLFGEEAGLYMHPDEEGQDWERAASVEWLEAGAEGFAVGSGIRVQGGSSTGNWKSPKVSMKLLFKEIYGASKLEYALFSESPVGRFDALILDAHLNQTWVHPSADQQSRADYIRDRYMADLQNELGSLAPHGRFANLFLNGLYWGLYEVHEQPDESFAAEHLGGDKADYDVLKHTGDEAVAGDTQAWDELMALARGDLDDMEALSELVELQDLADYMLLNFYGGNTDWPHHNWYAARHRDGGAFRFFSWDAEHVLKDVAEDVTDENDANTPGELFHELMRSPEYRDLFAERAALHLPGAMSGDPALFARRAAEIDDAIVLESARWGDYRRAQPYTRQDWLDEIDWIEDVWFPDRTEAVQQQLESRGWLP
jgi:hypothetical protein